LCGVPFVKENMGLIYEYSIPDPSRPIPVAERGICGASGERIPFEPPPLDDRQVVGEVVTAVSMIVGTYGMGSPGFFGLQLRDAWLVVAIWGASSWILFDGRLVEDDLFAEYGRSRPWVIDGDDQLSAQLIGHRIEKISVQRFSFSATISSGLQLSITEAPESRPLLEGSKEPREFARTDDLRRVVFVSPTTEIWV